MGIGRDYGRNDIRSAGGKSDGSSRSADSQRMGRGGNASTNRTAIHARNLTAGRQLAAFPISYCDASAAACRLCTGFHTTRTSSNATGSCDLAEGTRNYGSRRFDRGCAGR